MHVIVMCEPGRRGAVAIDQAAALTRRHGARLTLAVLLDLPAARRSGCLSWTAWRDLMVAEAGDELTRIAARIGPETGRAVLVEPATALDRLEALECDLLILPARARPHRFTRDPYASLRDAAGRASFPVADSGHRSGSRPTEARLPALSRRDH